jgi:hypothetical protein
LSKPKRSAARFASRRGGEAPDERGRYIVKPEWIRADTTVNAAFIVVGVYLVQTLLAPAPLTWRREYRSSGGWAVAIPLLAALAMLNVVREWYRYTSYPFYWGIAWSVAHGAALIALAAAFWHIWFPAAIVLTVSGVAGIASYQVSVHRLLRDNSAP